jgi:hypothetical protein
MAAEPEKALGAIDSTFAFSGKTPFGAALALGLSTPTRPQGAARSENTLVDG